MPRMLRLRSKQIRALFGGIAVTLAFAQACAASDSEKSGSTSADNAGSYGSTTATSTGWDGDVSASGGSTSASTLPEEVEVDVSFDGPQASAKYVYSTNADEDTVAVINASTLAIEIVETGDEPRFLKTIPGRDAALLVNVASGELAYLQTVDGDSSIEYYEDLPSANAIAMAPDGLHAVAYFDVTRVSSGNFETLQDVTVFSFAGETPVVARMTVGFKPRQVTFAGGDAGSAAAYVVTDDGVSILDFAAIDASGSGIAELVSIFSAVEQKGADVSVTPDGKYALGRISGSGVIRLVELSTGTAKDFEIGTVLPEETTNTGSGGATGAGGTTSTGSTETGGSTAVAGTETAGATSVAGTETGGATSVAATTAAATTTEATVDDLDLSTDGSFALAVSRNRSGLVRIPIPGGFSDASTVQSTIINDVLVGSTEVSPNGRWAVLYTTVETEERVVIVDLTGAHDPLPVDLSKAVVGVTFSTSGEQAFVVHTKADGDPLETGISSDEVIDRQYGYSLVQLEDGFRKLMIADSAPLQTIVVPDAPYVFLTFQGANYRVQRIDTDTMVGNWIDLGSQPVSMGVVPAAEQVFVNQVHEDGRMTFIDWNTLETRSVTGYAINSQVRE